MLFRLKEFSFGGSKLIELLDVHQSANQPGLRQLPDHEPHQNSNTSGMLLAHGLQFTLLQHNHSLKRAP